MNLESLLALLIDRLDDTPNYPIISNTPITVNLGKGFESVIDIVYCDECKQYHIISGKEC